MSSVRSVGALRRAALAVVCAASFASVAFAGPNPQAATATAAPAHRRAGPARPEGADRHPARQQREHGGADQPGADRDLEGGERVRLGKQNGVAPRLELALYEYGDGVKRLQPFTSELDRVSEKLFGISVHGGDEYCGQVIQAATNELEWSGDPDDLKLIYIAGNEPFTQGPVKPGSAIEAAKHKGITVNPIACGGDDPTGARAQRWPAATTW